MDYLIWAVPVMLWVAVTTHAATQNTPLLLLDRINKL